MWSTARQVAPGDLVIVWLTRDLIQSVLITPGKDFNSRYGHYRHSDLVGIPYGSKVPSRTGKGFIHILRPTPELWTLALPHRTQILYLADIAFITSWLHIRPGSVVVEAGTGSASFTHSIARTVGVTGHVFSYEFHEARANKAAEEFTRHGLSAIVTLTHRNVCKNGFTISDIADSVFLDLPAPWEAVEHAKAALRKDRLTRICCFSPCIEQVLRTVSALNEAGFTDITMYETLLRPHEVNQAPRLVRIDSVAEKLKQQERNREDKRQRQIAASRARRRYDAPAPEKRKRQEDDSDAPGVADPDSEHDPECSELEAKKAKTTTTKTMMIEQCDEDEDEGATSPVPDVAMDLVEEPPENEMHPPTTAADDDAEAAVPPLPTTSTSAPDTQVLSKHSKEVRGHTSFLTFACLLPLQPQP
ncbi:tRNA methyltransferase complex GCD14 subunit-domain-containing protein [Lactifluus volemus]|nr:tRNA methyltransferase complex GCD14 subunit-domain-containing protein [Lactifluus volemus]